MFQKTKEKILNTHIIANFKRMYPYVEPYKFRALLAVTLTIPVGAIDAVIAMFLKPFMDTVMIEKSAQDATYIPLLIILFSLIQSACNYGATYMNAWVGGKVTQGLKLTLFRKLIRLDSSTFDKMNSGEVIMRYASDADLACSMLLTTVKQFITRIFSSIALIGVLFWNSWQLSIIALTFVILSLYPVTQIRRKIKKLVKKGVESGQALTTSYNEVFSGNRVLTSYNLHNFQTKKFTDALAYIFRLNMKKTKKTGMLSPIMHFVISIGIAGVIWLGSYLILNDFLTPGEFVSFVAALLMLYTPIKAMGRSYAAVQTSLFAMERVFEVLDAQPNIASKENAIPLEQVKDCISYKDVSFEYIKDRPVLKNFNLEIKVGQNIAFVGNSGGGKTTTVNLLPRFYDITSGSLEIDGIDIRDYEIDSLRDQIAIVFQDNVLFSGTIKDNIKLGKPDATDEEIDIAVNNACLREFIESLEDGLNTEIGERGILLSGGQRQRVGIARAFMKNAPIVILDEATSALDNKSEKVVQEAINNLMQDRTVLIIAHRLSTVRHADKICVIDQGEIVEQGSHDELMAMEESRYKSLYNSSLY